ncbi:unnamed protein product, partial [Candidula unifasciata]
LLSVYVRNAEDEIILVHLQDTYPEVDFGIPPVHGKHIAVLVPPHLLHVFKSIAVEQGIPLTVLANDVQ